MMESHKKLDSGSAGLQAGEFATISRGGLQPARDLLFPPLVRLSLRPRFYGFALQRRNRLIVHVPHLQDAKDNTTGESGARQAAKHLGRVLLRCRFSDALALQILSRQLLLVDVLVRRTDRLVDDVTMDTLGLQILHHALAPKLLVFPAKAGVALGVIGVIQILLFLKFSNYYFNQQFTIKLGLDSLPHQPLQLPDGTHLASQRANGVLVQHRFVVHLLRASERHGAIISIHPIRHPERSDRRDRSQRTCCSRKVPGDLTICHHERSEGSAFLAPCNNPNVRHPERSPKDPCPRVHQSRFRFVITSEARDLLFSLLAIIPMSVIPSGVRRTPVPADINPASDLSSRAKRGICFSRSLQ